MQGSLARGSLLCCGYSGAKGESIFGTPPGKVMVYSDPSKEEEEARLQAKEEARKLLTQPVVQISAEQRKTVSQLNRESREKRVIHPIETQKRYNSKSAKKGEQAESEAARSEKNEVAVKSSLKKMPFSPSFRWSRSDCSPECSFREAGKRIFLWLQL